MIGHANRTWHPKSIMWCNSCVSGWGSNRLAPRTELLDAAIATQVQCLNGHFELRLSILITVDLRKKPLEKYRASKQFFLGFGHALLYRWLVTWVASYFQLLEPAGRRETIRQWGIWLLALLIYDKIPASYLVLRRISYCTVSSVAMKYCKSSSIQLSTSLISVFLGY